MSRVKLTRSVLEESIARMEVLFAEGHRPVVTCSGGKDSTVVLEICIEAARRTNRLPVDVALQEEEINMPGTYEYLERTAARPEVSMNWLVMQQATINYFNRVNPYWWVMDPLLTPDQWVRKPPSYAKFVTDKEIDRTVTPERFPIGQYQKLYKVLGLRVSESVNRRFGIFASGGYLQEPNEIGVIGCRPVYDWVDADVWKFIHESGCDYNKAYDTMRRMGVPAKELRIAPPTMNGASIRTLQLAHKAWPQWFDRVATRLPGIRSAASFGLRVCSPNRRYGETWEQCFHRECLGPDVPEWIRVRAELAMQTYLKGHAVHATTPFPETSRCYRCQSCGSWRLLARTLWNGDPFSTKMPFMSWVEPEFFRPGAGQFIPGRKKGKITW